MAVSTDGDGGGRNLIMPNAVAGGVLRSVALTAHRIATTIGCCGHMHFACC